MVPYARGLSGGRLLHVQRGGGVNNKSRFLY